MSADLVYAQPIKKSKPEKYKLVFGNKMSVVSNYKFTQPNKVEFIGIIAT